METTAVKVKFKTYTGWSKEYTYLCEKPVSYGDYVVVPDSAIDGGFMVGRVKKILSPNEPLQEGINYKHVVHVIGPLRTK